MVEMTYIAIRVSKEIHKKIKSQAAKEGRTMMVILEQLLKEYLEKVK